MKRIDAAKQVGLKEHIAIAVVAELGVRTSLQAVVDNVTECMTPDCKCEHCELNETLRTSLVASWNTYVQAVHRLRNKGECTH
jgi:hypothetical protein